MKTIIYSAIYGDHDEPKKQPLGIKPILFTDSIESEDYEVRKVERKEVHPRMQAKYFKCMPHEVLDCDVSIWVDGNAMILQPGFVEWCLEQLGDNDIAVIKHPDRNCIYKEAIFCKGMAKYQDVDVLGQVAEYRQEGFPDDYGLWACGLLIRRHNKRIKKFNKMWWEHNLKYTYQDQLSFPVCVKRSGVKLKTINLPLNENNLITFLTPHASNK